MGHAVQGAAADEYLCSLCLEQSRAHPITEDDLDPKHPRLKPCYGGDNQACVSKQHTQYVGCTAGSYRELTAELAIPPGRGARIWQHGNSKALPLARDKNEKIIDEGNEFFHVSDHEIDCEHLISEKAWSDIHIIIPLLFDFTMA